MLNLLCKNIHFWWGDSRLHFEVLSRVVARISMPFVLVSFACMIIHICPPVPPLLWKWSVLWQGVNWLGPAVCMCTGVCLRACPHLHTNVCVCICQHVDSVSSVGGSLRGPGTCGSPPVWVALSSVPNMRSEPPQPCPALLGSVRPRPPQTRSHRGATLQLRGVH